jgi:hypothetical protein
MSKPTKRVLSEYHTLVVKTIMDFASNNSTKVNFELLCDIEVFSWCFMGLQSCYHCWRR